MSNLIEAKVWKLKMPPTPKFVLVSLADQANDEGVCWPSIGSIEQRTCFSDRAIQKALVWLEKCNYIKRIERKGRSTYYTVTPELGSPLVVNDVPPAADSPTSERPTGQGEPRSPQGEPRSPITITQPPQNPQGTAPKPARPADLLFETLAEVCGLDWRNLGKLERGRLNVAARDLREISATPQDVKDRAAAYVRLWPKVSLTPTALAANWSQCIAKPSTTASAAPPPARSQLDSDLETADYEARRLGLALRGADEDPRAYINRVNDAVSSAVLADHNRRRRVA